MTEREPAPNALPPLTPEQFLAQFADRPDHEGRGVGHRPADWRALDPVADSGRDRVAAESVGDETHRLSARFAVPETATRPPLPPTPSAAGRNRGIPPIPPRSVLQLSDETPAGS